VRGWETATDAQARIVAEIEACLGGDLDEAAAGDVLVVGHGAVGTLLYCALAGLPISRRYDQPPGGGCCFAFSIRTRRPIFGWRPMERIAGDLDHPAGPIERP
jgi:broad specificity phosphatase PhoE